MALTKRNILNQAPSLSERMAMVEKEEAIARMRIQNGYEKSRVGAEHEETKTGTEQIKPTPTQKDMAEQNINHTLHSAPEEPERKSKAKADSIARIRPMQVSLHFTKGEKRLLNSIKEYLEDNGIIKPTVEDIVHNAVYEWISHYRDAWPTEQFDNTREKDFSKIDR